MPTDKDMAAFLEKKCKNNLVGDRDLETIIRCTTGARIITRLMMYMVECGISHQQLNSLFTESELQDDDPQAECRKRGSSFVRKLMVGV